jgi:hypothetical protein
VHGLTMGQTYWVVLLAALTACHAVEIDPALDAQCQDWLISNQKDMIILNQVASQSHITTCNQYCMVAGSGFRADTTTCRHLCELSGGYTEFSNAMKSHNGGAAPVDICKAMFSAIEKKASPHAVSFMQVEQSTAERKLGVRGDMTVQGTLSTSILTSPIGDVKVSGELNVMNSIQTTTARSAYLKSSSGVSIKSGISSKKDQLIVKGRIDADSVTASGLRSSFLEIDGVKQWAMHAADDFEEKTTDGWNGEITECAGHHILGGHCVEKAIPELTKTFTKLPPHTHLRVTAKYMFIDSWDGESGFMKIDGNTVWVQTHNHAEADAKHAINLCGGPAPETRFGIPIYVTIPHTAESATVSFGATLDEHPCDESFGVDSVMVFTR